jgi:hypothetical protein
MKAFLEILDTIDPEFKKNPRLINGKVKRQITQKSGHVGLIWGTCQLPSVLIA